MARLHIKKRTKQLDDAREVLLSGSASNPIWTTRGELELSGDDKKELSANLAAQRRQAALHKHVERVLEGFATFLLEHLYPLAPASIQASFNNSDDNSLYRWAQDNGFRFERKGLEAVLLHKGSVIASTKATVDPFYRSDIEQMLKWEETMERNGL